MIILVRRVLSSSVTVNLDLISQIGKGMLLYVGFSRDDTQEECKRLAMKVANLRIFCGNGGDVSIKDYSGHILSVSQFTLAADTKKGNRPSYNEAMPSDAARVLFDFFNECLEQNSGITVQRGIFGADMHIHSIDDGPFTIILS